MKNILIIALLFISALDSKADDYYDIPVGWEKVVEFDSTNNILMFLAENDNILYYNGNSNSTDRGWHHSKNAGKLFYKLNVNFETALGKAFFYKGKLCYFDGTANGFYLFRFDVETSVLDSVNVTKPVGGIVSKIYINEIDNTIIFKITNPTSNGEYQLCFISRNGGENWELLDLFKYDHRYNIYDFRFDMKTPNRWIYVASDAYDPSHGVPPPPQPERFFLTEDNGKSFIELIKPNIKLFGIGEYSYETDTLDKYLSFDFKNSIRGTLKTKTTSNLKYYYQSGFVIKDILSIQPDTSENMLQIIGNIVEKDTSKNPYLAIYQDYSTKYNQLIFRTSDNFAFFGMANDTIYSKIILWDAVNKIPIIILKRNVKFITNVSYDYPTKITYFDKTNDYLYAEISKPINPFPGWKQRIIIRKKLLDPSSIETEKEKLETINLTDNKLTIYKDFTNPRITIYDILTKEHNYKILSYSPLTIELDQNIADGCYFISIEENLSNKYYKFIKNK